MCSVWNKQQENHGTVLASMVQATRSLSVICPYIRATQVNDLLGDSQLQSLRVITLWSFRTFLAGSSEPEALRHLGRIRQQPRMWPGPPWSRSGLCSGAAVRTGMAASHALDRGSRRPDDHALDQERDRSHELLEHLEELEQRLSEVVSDSPSVWTPQEDQIIVKLAPDQIEFLQRPLRGQGGYQSLLGRLQGNMSGDFLRLTRTDCERVVRYSMRYGQGGFQTRLHSIVRLAEQFIS